MTGTDNKRYRSAAEELEEKRRRSRMIHRKRRIKHGVYVAVVCTFLLIVSLINSFKVFREVYLLTGDHPVDTVYMLQHFMNNTFNSLDYQKLSAAAVITAGAMVVIIGMLFAIDKRFGGGTEE